MSRLSASEVVAAQKAHQQYAAARAMHRVVLSDAQLSASLRNLGAEIREASQAKQNPPELADAEGFTDPRQEVADGMVADDQCDRRR